MSLGRARHAQSGSGCRCPPRGGLCPCGRERPVVAMDMHDTLTWFGSDGAGSGRQLGGEAFSCSCGSDPNFALLSASLYVDALPAWPNSCRSWTCPDALIATSQAPASLGSRTRHEAEARSGRAVRDRRLVSAGAGAVPERPGAADPEGRGTHRGRHQRGRRAGAQGRAAAAFAHEESLRAESDVTEISATLSGSASDQRRSDGRRTRGAGRRPAVSRPGRDLGRTEPVTS